MTHAERRRRERKDTAIYYLTLIVGAVLYAGLMMPGTIW